MRRLAAIFVLIVLPLQWTYAAVAEYCQHEANRTAQQHVGHHAHNHVDPPSDQDGSKNGSLDWDCPACHHSAGAFVPSVTVDGLPTGASRMVVLSSRVIPHRAPDNPFRPPLIAGA